MQLIVERVGNGAAEEDWRWDLNPGTAATPREDHAALAEKGGATQLWWSGAPLLGRQSGPCGFRLLLFATRLRKQESLPGRKGEKGLLLVGHEKVPHGSGLTGDCGGSTADGAGTEGLPELLAGLLLLFLRYGTLDWAKGRRKNCVHLWVF